MTLGNEKSAGMALHRWVWLMGVAVLGGAGVVACGGNFTPSVTTPNNPGDGPLPATVPLLTDTGVDSSMCFAAGNTTSFVSCNSPEARALNAQQDGMVGRDVAYPDDSDGRLGFSYTKLDASGGGLLAGSTALWSCVKDNLTGLTWEVKTADGGLRDMNKTYTNYGDNSVGDASTFVTMVNAAGLCGYRDWRLPTIEELQTIVNYGGTPSIDNTFFPNTPPNVFWSSSPIASDPSLVWGVYFDVGGYTYGSRSITHAVRLVR